MKTPTFLAIALAMSVSAFSQTSAPPAPTLTAGAEFKGLRFDWSKVSGATWYQLEYRAHQTGSFVQTGDDYPATATSTHFSFPLHLFDWTYARYRLAACNSAGCSRSAEVSVSNLRRDAVGYFKAADSVGSYLFGDAADLSPDGYNMVASAPGVENGNNAAYLEGGAAYVFKRGSDGKWIQRARFDLGVKATEEDAIHLDVATSASGNTMAVGMPTFLRSDGSEGQVDVFQFTNNAWTRTRIPPRPENHFGGRVALDESGSILAIGHDGDLTSAAIYKLVNGTWQNVRNLSLTDQGYQEHCDPLRMSRDGKVIAERCEEAASAGRPRRDYLRLFSGSNWSVRTEIDLRFPTSAQVHYLYWGVGLDRTGDTLAVQFSQNEDGNLNGSGAVRVYKLASGKYSLVTTLTPGAWRTANWKFTYGQALSVSGDGQTLAVSDLGDNGTGWGPRAAPLIGGTAQLGAVYVYRLSGAWKLANMVKPNYNPNPDQPKSFGERVLLSQSGKTLIIPVPAESSSAKGIDGNWANSDAKYSGAIFMY